MTTDEYLPCLGFVCCCNEKQTLDVINIVTVITPFAAAADCLDRQWPIKFMSKKLVCAPQVRCETECDVPQGNEPRIVAWLA